MSKPAARRGKSCSRSAESAAAKTACLDHDLIVMRHLRRVRRFFQLFGGLGRIGSRFRRSRPTASSASALSGW